MAEEAEKIKKERKPRKEMIKEELLLVWGYFSLIYSMGGMVTHTNMDHYDVVEVLHKITVSDATANMKEIWKKGIVPSY